MIKAVYIVSSSFSGSTLLSMFWAAHPDFTSNGELVRKIRYPYPLPLFLLPADTGMSLLAGSGRSNEEIRTKF